MPQTLQQKLVHYYTHDVLDLPAMLLRLGFKPLGKCGYGICIPIQPVYLPTLKRRMTHVWFTVSDITKHGGWDAGTIHSFVMTVNQGYTLLNNQAAIIRTYRQAFDFTTDANMRKLGRNLGTAIEVLRTIQFEEHDLDSSLAMMLKRDMLFYLLKDPAPRMQMASKGRKPKRRVRLTYARR